MGGSFGVGFIATGGEIRPAGTGIDRLSSVVVGLIRTSKAGGSTAVSIVLRIPIGSSELEGATVSTPMRDVE